MTEVHRTRDEELLRKFEKDVLDRDYLNHPFWQFPEEHRLWGLLTAYDSMLTVFAMCPPGSEARADALAREWDDGFVQAVQWSLGVSDAVRIRPVADRALLETSIKFIKYANGYASIADFHMMYGHGLLKVEVTEDPPRIRFLPHGSVFPDPEVAGYLQSVKIQEKQSRDRQSRIRAQLSIAPPPIANIRYSLSEGRIVIENLREIAADDFRNLVDVMSPEEIVPVPDETALDGFTMGEFRSFWKVLMALSFCNQVLFLQVARKGVPQENCAATQFVPRDLFAALQLDLTGLGAETVSRITSLLTLGRGISKPHVFLQPLICSNDKWLCWCPRLVFRSRYERNLLKLLARIPDLAGLAATVVGSRSRPLASSLGKFLAKYGYQYSIMKKLGPAAKHGDIDLLAYSKKYPDQVLLVECKAVLPVDSVNEIADATAKMQKGQQQLRKAIRYLSEMPTPLKRELCKSVDWSKVRNVYGLVVTPDADPNSDYDQAEFPATSLVAMMHLMRMRDIASPERLCTAARNMDWVRSMVPAGGIQFRKLVIGNVLYELPVYRKASDSAEEANPAD